jgi:hypothetical protein
VSDPRTIEGPGERRAGRVRLLPFLVPRVDADGNETAGIRVPDLAVPLATATGWNFRSPRVGNPSTIYALLGSYIPLSRTPSARNAAGDPRPSVAERYASKDDYLLKIEAAAAPLLRERLLLAEDLPSVRARANAHWDAIAGLPVSTAVR